MGIYDSVDEALGFLSGTNGKSLLNMISPRPSIDAISQIPFLTGTEWQLFIFDPKPKKAEFGSFDLDSLGVASDSIANLAIRLLVQSIDRPFNSLETERRIEGVRYTGYSRELSTSISFLETEKHFVSNYLQSWMDSVYDSRNRVFKTGVKPWKNALLINFASNGVNPNTGEGFLATASNGAGVLNASPVARVIYYDKLFIEDVSSLSFSYSNNEALTMDASFSVEGVYDLGLLDSVSFLAGELGAPVEGLTNVLGNLPSALTL
mgnify:FL=1